MGTPGFLKITILKIVLGSTIIYGTDGLLLIEVLPVLRLQLYPYACTVLLTWFYMAVQVLRTAVPVLPSTELRCTRATVLLVLVLLLERTKLVQSALVHVLSRTDF